MRNPQIEKSAINAYLRKYERLVQNTTPVNHNKSDSPYWSKYKQAYHLYLCYLSFKCVIP